MPPTNQPPSTPQPSPPPGNQPSGQPSRPQNIGGTTPLTQANTKKKILAAWGFTALSAATLAVGYYWLGYAFVIGLLAGAYALATGLRTKNKPVSIVSALLGALNLVGYLYIFIVTF